MVNFGEITEEKNKLAKREKTSSSIMDNKK